MPYKQSGGKQCVVIGCTNSQKKLHDWTLSTCFEHRIPHKDRACLPPYKFHCLPANKNNRRSWLKAINRKDFNPASKSLATDNLSTCSGFAQGTSLTTSQQKRIMYQYCTWGIPYQMFVKTLSPFGRKLPYRLNVADQIFAVIVRLRLGLTYQDIARRLAVSAQLMSNIFNSWLDIMAKHLSDCVVWLPRDTIRRSLPSSFMDTFPHTTCIIDCTEIFIQRPFKLKERAQTWSTYKNNNTAKYLVAVAPNGFIMFISKLYCGRASDVYITKNSGFLDYLLPGDEVMADRGFTISEDLCYRRVKLNIPAFMKEREQLSEEEVIDTRRIASNRIHVERAIMRMKSYRILSLKMSNKSLNRCNKTLRVVSALCNLRDPLIKEECEDN